MGEQKGRRGLENSFGSGWVVGMDDDGAFSVRSPLW